VDFKRLTLHYNQELKAKYKLCINNIQMLNYQLLVFFFFFENYLLNLKNIIFYEGHSLGKQFI